MGSPTPPPATATPNLVTVPIPVLPAHEGTYVYVAVKGSLHAEDSAIFGLNNDEIRALADRFSFSSAQIVNGVLIKASLTNVLNSLSQLGYKVVCSTGENEIVWTMAREI